MTNGQYNLMIAAISDYLGKSTELGKNASHFSHNGCYVFRLWSEDAPEIMQTRIKTDGVIDGSDVLIVLNADGTWKFLD